MLVPALLKSRSRRDEGLPGLFEERTTAVGSLTSVERRAFLLRLGFGGCLLQSLLAPAGEHDGEAVFEERQRDSAADT